MPSNIVHWYFAKRVYEGLPGDAKILAQKDMQSYLVGGQGPDLMFYMRFEKPPLNLLGEIMHDSFDTAALFAASATYAKTSSDAGILTAFLMGQLCHYALDSELHPYICYREIDLPAYYPPAAKVHIHVLFESALDYLCVRDYLKVNPKRYMGYKNMNLSASSRQALGRYYSAVVAPRFGMTVPPQTAAKSIKLMRTFLRICDDKTGVRYGVMRLVETLARTTMAVSSFVRPRKERIDEDWLNHKRLPVPKYNGLPEIVTLTVEEMAAIAYEKARKLIKNFLDVMEGSAEIDASLYQRNYTGAIPEAK